jgi:hypothetical protein
MRPAPGQPSRRGPVRRSVLIAHAVLWPVLLLGLAAGQRIATVANEAVSRGLSESSPSSSTVTSILAVSSVLTWWVGVALPQVAAGVAAAIVLRPGWARAAVAAVAVLFVFGLDALFFAVPWGLNDAGPSRVLLTVDGFLFGAVLALGWLLVRGRSRSRLWLALVAGIAPAALNGTGAWNDVFSWGGRWASFTATAAIYIAAVAVVAWLAAIRTSSR